MRERNYLRKGDKLKLARKKDGTHCDEWTIEKFIGEGASCVCYSARCGQTVGRLKEFYPLEAELKRNENQLVSEEFTGKKFYERLCEEFLSSFEILNEARNKPEGQVLNNYLPVQELLYGFDDGQRAGVYIWSPNDRHGFTLEEYFKATPPDKRNLNEILQLVLNLAEFLRAIHSLGLLHLDIKPSNILVTCNDKNEINPQNITIFDSDSIYNLNSENPCRSRGTSGFSAPELSSNGKATNRCDIFSLGTILFSALTDKAYTRKDYPNLEKFVAGSCEFGVEKKRQLTRILRQALAHCSIFRYKDIETMIKNLRNLMNSTEKSIVDAKTILQNLLYETSPLFTLEKNFRWLKILVIGEGEFAKKFMDQALQCAQVPYIEGGEFSAREICIENFCENADRACKNYLSSRRALTEYIGVNGKSATVAEYGQINFWQIPTLEGHDGLGFSENPEVNRRIARKIISALDDVQYIFIALDDADLNRLTAEAFAQILRDCPVNFIADEKNISPELERQGFNVHCSWLNSLSGVDMNELRENYLEPYNRISSLDFALSIKYKLIALGIELKNFDKAAQDFTEKISDETLAILSEFEHRRWLIEKICDNWQAPKKSDGKIDYELCISSLRLNGKPQDDKNHLHHCILPSRKDFTLRDHPEKWNEPPDAELDALDRMSIELHQALIREASRIKHTPFRTYLQDLRNELDDEKILAAFNKFELYLNQIWSGNKNHSRNFKAYVKEFKAALGDKLTPTVAEKLETLRRNFIVIAESNRRIDYKLNDLILVKRIPFILTFEPPKIAMAFDDGRFHKGSTTDIFRNVAAATVINPLQITYFYCVDDKFRAENFSEKIRSVLAYFAEKKIRAEINFAVAIIAENNFDEFDAAGIKNFIIQRCENFSEASDFFLRTMKNFGEKILFDGSTTLFASALTQSDFTQKIIKDFPYFEFDFVAKKFLIRRVCEHLRFIEDNSSLSVRDIFSLNQVEIQTQNIFSAADYYQKLWEIFTENISACMECFKRLEDFDKKNFEVTTLKPANSSTVVLKYYPPEHAVNRVENFLQQLLDARIITNFSIDAGTLEIQTSAENEKPLDEILTKIFYSPDAEIEINGENIIFRTLEVKDFSAPNNIVNILRRFAEERFLLNFRERDGKINFRYASKPIKNMLTSLATTLKIFVYLEVLKRGYFDDAACDVTFIWRRNVQKFDIVLTKNFVSLMIKILEKNSIDLYKFSALADKVGIRSKKVCVPIDNDFDDELATVEIIRPAEIVQVAETLIKIMED